jgi:hypothetical protein
MQQGNLCVALASVCGAGTHEDNGTCVPDVPRFVIRASREIEANGQPADVLVLGRNPDGSPSTESIVLNTNRAGSGTFPQPSFALAETGTRTTFVPCSASIPGCLGPLELTVAAAAAPTSVLATFAVELVDTPRIGTIAPCLVGGNVLHLESKNLIYPGALTVTDGSFTLDGAAQRGAVVVVPTDPVQGTRYSLDFSTVQLGQPIAVGVYRDAQQTYGGELGHAGINVGGAGPYGVCHGGLTGEFEVHAFEVVAGKVDRMTISFRQWCGIREVRGCIHVE